jgi:hypothetical protein
MLELVEDCAGILMVAAHCCIAGEVQKKLQCVDALRLHWVHYFVHSLYKHSEQLSVLAISASVWPLFTEIQIGVFMECFITQHRNNLRLMSNEMRTKKK